MKSFAGPSLFRAFDMLLGATNPGLKKSRWIQHERHSLNGPRHGFAIEIFSLMRQGKRGWSLMVVKEFCYTGKDYDAARMRTWRR